ncbi:hypothetical protein K5X82_18935 [Halosquirtibacter xylanolyticus]|uniref:hypothetical protein n=1 Tax=Halosquirtibacter xylanolyticus TaxID=3374599 RepID=UPI003749049D|nr:hypothetical protein K5X82_18935 [Prolixibacteraceae bacterium]
MISKTTLKIFVLLLFVSSIAFAQKSEKKMIYIMDPMCAWCYGNIKTINKIQQEVDGTFPIEVYCGGMWTGKDVPHGGPEFYNLLRKHTPSIVIKTKERFSSDYYKSLTDTTYRFSSFEPSKALWIVKKIASKEFWKFKENVQRGIFEKAMRSDHLDGYLEIVDSMGIDHNAFIEMWSSKEVDQQVQTEFEISSSYSNSYPTLLLVEGDKRTVLGKGYFYADKILKAL